MKQIMNEELDAGDAEEEEENEPRKSRDLRRL